MNINIENITSAKFFEKLEIGDTFISHNVSYMKIIEVTNVETGALFNAVNLKTGELDFFSEYVTIHKIIIENATAKYIE